MDPIRKTISQRAVMPDLPGLTRFVNEELRPLLVELRSRMNTLLSGVAGLRISSTSDIVVCSGSGAPTLSAPKGSFYLRSDGSGTNDRAYINTDGGTTWTALVTVA